ncbi:MAG: hypothetical protein Q8R57_13605 [Bacteroidota bacterium]|jgi:hypothetical protein|nr:hypothetical protein [Bacteroidota bacterium]
MEATTAQLFHPKDSLRKQRVIQVGLGVYTGVNKVIPQNEDLNYGTADGLEFGLLYNVYFNLTNHIYFKLGYRMNSKTAMINHGNYLFYESFKLKQIGSTIPVMLYYNFHNKGKSLFDVGIGVANNQYKNEVELVYANLNRPTLGHWRGDGSNFIEGRNVKGMSYLLACSKTIQLNKSISWVLFSEFEWVSPQIEILNTFYNGTNTYTEFWAKYQTYQYRVGTEFKF